MTDFNLNFEPAERVVIANKKLGEERAHTTLKITNNGKDLCVFHIAASRGCPLHILEYRSYGLIGPADVISIEFTLNGGKTVPKSGKHFLAFNYIFVEKIGNITARDFWKTHKPTGTQFFYVDFIKEDAAAADANNNEKDKKEEGKKDDEKKEEGGDLKDDEKKDDDKKEEKKEDEKKPGAGKSKRTKKRSVRQKQLNSQELNQSRLKGKVSQHSKVIKSKQSCGE